MRWCGMWFGILLAVALASMGITQLTEADSLFAPLGQTASISITNPGAIQVTIGEGDDFATQVLGDPWDMDRRRDIGYEVAFDQVGATGGTWSGAFTGQDQLSGGTQSGYFFPLFQGFDGALNWVTSGANDHQAIDTADYRYLSYRLNVSTRTNYAVYWTHLANWPDGSQYFAGTDGCFYVDGSWVLHRWPGLHNYFYDMTAVNGDPGATAGSWQAASQVRGLRLDPSPSDTTDGTQVDLEWVRLIDPDASEVITIEWSAPGANPSDEVDLYVATDASGTDATPMIRDLAASAGAYNFYPSILPPGMYYLSLVLREDWGCGPYRQRASTPWTGPLTIMAAPQISIQAPSMTSGPDYAAEVVGDPWDMSNSEDVWFPDWTDPEIDNVTFSGGVFSGDAVKRTGSSVPHSNAQFLFTLDSETPIDPTVYRYFSIRYGVDAPVGYEINWLISHGWGARVIWGEAAYDQAQSKYAQYYEGWGTYSFDLADSNVPEPETSSPSWTDFDLVNYLRFDPMESTPEAISAGANHFHVDWAMLTAMDSISQGETYPIEYSLDAQSGADLTFYYDADRDPGNGRTLIGTDVVAPPDGGASAPTADESDYSVYLPLIMNAGAGAGCGDGCYAWDTIGVPAGEYYVCILAQDDYSNATYRCSDAPLKID